jgi:hypothetical protein
MRHVAPASREALGQNASPVAERRLMIQRNLGENLFKVIAILKKPPTQP